MLALSGSILARICAGASRMGCSVYTSSVLTASRNKSASLPTTSDRQKDADGPRNLRSLLKRYGERELEHVHDHAPQVGMFVHHEIANAVKSEYNWARKRMDRSRTRRRVERLLGAELRERRRNVLTVAQKTQLRRLAADDPDMWTPQKLAPAFGVSPDAIRRLLKSRWLPTSPEHVARHDAKVAARRKSLGLPPPSEPPPMPASTPATAATPRHGLRALVERFSAPPPAETTQHQLAPSPVISAVYSRRDVLQFDVSDGRSEPTDMRRTGVKVRMPGRHMTLEELKMEEKRTEEKKRLKQGRTKPEL